MKANVMFKKWLGFLRVFVGTFVLSLCVAHSAFGQVVQSRILSQSPLFQSVPVTPIMMLNMSRDHQLFFKVYDDYADITGDGVPDTTYNNNYDYYGYFDSAKCYVYNTTNERFEPSRLRSNRYCNQVTNVTNEWSGNFLNWSTMTRMDAVRKILYGGYRSTDETSLTVLERAFLPHDAHSFAKYYNGTDINYLTPFTVASGLANTQASGITLCNTTHAANGKSQSTTAPPLIRVAKGNYSLWASNETWQCYWTSEKNNVLNANDPATSGVWSSSTTPPNGDKMSVTSLNAAHPGDYYARVKVCDSNLLGDEKCTLYGTSTYKPTGLLQTYGEETQTDNKALINFGLITGSYGANKSGGVVRKNVSSMRTEINPTTGVFTGVDGVIKTLDKLRIFGYDYGSGGYTGTAADDDNCGFDKSGFANGQCTNWGNPQSEIYLESLRYLAGKTAPTTTFNVDDSGRIAGLNKVSNWTDPLSSANYCAPLNIIQFNASSSSYDTDSLSSDLGIGDVNAIIDLIGNSSHENLNGSYYIGENGGTNANDNNQLCTAKTATSLSKVKGTCPDSPRMQGGYGIAGLAYYARLNDLRNNLSGSQTIRTYGVSLAPAVPSITVKDPDATSTKQITILPACKNLKTSTNVDGVSNQPATSEGNCGLVDFKIVSQNIAGSVATGTLYINWEAAEAGGDYDQDMWGVLRYQINFTTNAVSITTRVYAESSSRPLGFGYIISGTTDDGFKVHSGINDFKGNIYPNCLNDDQCTCNPNNTSPGACTALANTAAKTYTIGTSSAKFLKPPLYYAAKWGGFTDYVANGLDKTLPDYESRLAAIVKNWDPTNLTYFYATDPRTLERSLASAMSQISAQEGSATSVATNSTKLNGEIALYQARFTSVEWSGEIKAYKLNPDGTVSSNLLWDTDDATSPFPKNSDGRKIFTHNGTNGVEFTWNNLSTTQKTAFRGSDTDAVAQNKLNWVRGDRSNEGASGLRERTREVMVNGVKVQRTRLLGDVVNSDPSFSGGNNLRYDSLPYDGASSYADYVDTKKSRTPMLYVGSNDGMLHAINANTGAEVFAYIPSAVIPKLAATAKHDYGQEFNPHQYFVDGPSYTADVYDGHNWKTILVGTLGAGGKGIFVLDVTDPENFQASNVLFEYNGSNSDDVGYIFSPPIIVPMADGTWDIVFGNGYQSTNGKSILLAINVLTKAVKKIDTNVTGGLSGAALLANAQRVTTTAYAGDSAGNMWKFDLSSSSRSNWDSAYKSGATSVPLIKAISGSGVAQPITGTPTIGYRAAASSFSEANMVYFGTGEYLYDGDEALTTMQTFYGIADEGSALSLTTANRETLLHKKSITEATDTAIQRTVRSTDEQTNKVDWSTRKGWFLDLKSPSLTSSVGERVISKPILVYDRVIFPTLIASQDACAAGGDGWLMELVGVGNMYENYHVFDHQGVKLDAAIMSLSDVIVGGEKLYIPTSDTKGGINIFGGNTIGTNRGRYSWRQLR